MTTPEQEVQVALCPARDTCGVAGGPSKCGCALPSPRRPLHSPPPVSDELLGTATAAACAPHDAAARAAGGSPGTDPPADAAPGAPLQGAAGQSLQLSACPAGQSAAGLPTAEAAVAHVRMLELAKAKAVAVEDFLEAARLKAELLRLREAVEAAAGVCPAAPPASSAAAAADAQAASPEAAAAAAASLRELRPCAECGKQRPRWAFRPQAWQRMGKGGRGKCRTCSANSAAAAAAAPAPAALVPATPESGPAQDPGGTLHAPPAQERPGRHERVSSAATSGTAMTVGSIVSSSHISSVPPSAHTRRSSHCGSHAHVPSYGSHGSCLSPSHDGRHVAFPSYGSHGSCLSPLEFFPSPARELSYCPLGHVLSHGQDDAPPVRSQCDTCAAMLRHRPVGSVFCTQCGFNRCGACLATQPPRQVAWPAGGEAAPGDDTQRLAAFPASVIQRATDIAGSSAVWAALSPADRLMLANAASSVPTELVPGAPVEYLAHGMWYPGWVSACNPDGTFCVTWNAEGASTNHIPPSFIRCRQVEALRAQLPPELQQRLAAAAAQRTPTAQWLSPAAPPLQAAAVDADGMPPPRDAFPPEIRLREGAMLVHVATPPSGAAADAAPGEQHGAVPATTTAVNPAGSSDEPGKRGHRRHVRYPNF
eukprot:TRINITY_DN5806_c2_g1_i1.p1 TRINITY_DN5806_c2_g1~~TRINITY_DN5806_c2_g1_i1.p1  ORF type:complete len:651 (+),score=140.56 TRINITY_DN5806_c2_g1_i1:110-2062(+)